MCRQRASNHRCSQTISLMTLDMQRLSHLKGLPLGRIIASAVQCLMVLVLRWLSVGYLDWLNRNFWMNHRCSGFQLMMVQKPVTHEAPRKTMRASRVARLLAHRAEAKPPSRMWFCRKSMMGARLDSVFLVRPLFY